MHICAVDLDPYTYTLRKRRMKKTKEWKKSEQNDKRKVERKHTRKELKLKIKQK